MVDINLHGKLKIFRYLCIVKVVHLAYHPHRTVYYGIRTQSTRAFAQTQAKAQQRTSAHLVQHTRIDALIADNNKRLSYFLNDKGMSRASHPVNPIRVQALNLFATVKSQAELKKGMEELISILLKVGDSEQDEHTARFIASAGIIVAYGDDGIKKEEIDRIVAELASLKIFPRKFLDEIISGDVVKTFNESVENLLKINPGMREGMLRYMIDIVMTDQVISKEEIELLYNFGESVGLSKIEVANAIAEAIQQNYIPSLDSIV